MVRGKVEMKRIEDKVSRQVSFSKRRNGMMKKAHELAVMCEVDVAAFVFSPKGRLYEFSTDESMPDILTRYQSFKETEELARVRVHEKLATEHGDVCTADELTEMIQRHLDENNTKLLDEMGLHQLEQQLHSSLQQVRIRKTELKLRIVKDLKDKEKQLMKERNSMMDAIMANRNRMNEINDDPGGTEQPQPEAMEIQIKW